VACVRGSVRARHRGRQGWLCTVPERLHRQARTATLALVGVLVAFLLTVGYLDRVDDMMGGWHWAAIGFAAIESLLTVFGPVWLLGIAQRHLDRRLRWTGAAVRRSAFAAFILQTPVLIGFATALDSWSVVRTGAPTRASIEGCGTVPTKVPPGWGPTTLFQAAFG
jgi:hypothetical protein